MRGFPAVAEDGGSSGAPTAFMSHVPRAPARLDDLLPLPSALAFLTGEGVDAALLQRVAQLARAQGVTAEAVLLGEGLLDPEAYYRALACHCGVRFAGHEITLVSSARYPHSVHAGVAEIVPLHGSRWLMAPRGPAIEHLLAAVAGGLAGFEITTPARLSHAVQLQCRRQLLSDASFGITKVDPSLSAYKRGGNWRPQALLAGIVATTVLCAWSGLVAALVAILCGCVFAGGIFTRLCALVAACDRARAEPPPLADRDLPVYTLVVPLYDEAEVLAELTQAFDRLDYPKAKLDIKLVVEACDCATRSAIAALGLPARYEVVVAPEGKPRTKPRALNLGLHLARGDLLVVFDAEDRPEPQQLRRAAAAFAAKPWLACQQAKLAIDNAGDSWLTRMFAVEYAALFDVVDPGLCQLGLPLPLGGTSNHFRTSVLRDIYGWDAWNVTEDADLGLRLARLGHEVECLDTTTLEEAPITLQAWLGQRRRWQKGWLQTIGTHMAEPARFWRELGAFRAISCAFTLMGMALGGLLGPVFALALWRAVQFERLLAPVSNLEILVSTLATGLFLAGLAAAVLPAWLGMRRRGLAHLLPWLAALPVYHLLCSLAAWQGLLELCSRPFHWQKTRHGVSKTRRSAAIAVPAAPAAD